MKSNPITNNDGEVWYTMDQIKPPISPQVVRPGQTCLVCGDHWSWIGIIFGICFCGPLTCCIRHYSTHSTWARKTRARFSFRVDQVDFLKTNWIKGIKGQWRSCNSFTNETSCIHALRKQPHLSLQAALLLIFQVPCSTSPAYHRGRSSSTSTSLGQVAYQCTGWWRNCLAVFVAHFTSLSNMSNQELLGPWCWNWYYPVRVQPRPCNIKLFLTCGFISAARWSS